MYRLLLVSMGIRSGKYSVLLKYQSLLVTTLGKYSVLTPTAMIRPQDGEKACPLYALFSPGEHSPMMSSLDGEGGKAKPGIRMLVSEEGAGGSNQSAGVTFGK